MEVKGDSQNTSEDVPSDPINEVYMERKIGLLGAIGMVLGCIIGALGLAELASLIPKSAGEYNYLRITYWKWLGFLQAWTTGLLIEPSGQAVVAMTSAQYMLVPVFRDGCGDPPLSVIRMLAATIILLPGAYWLMPMCVAISTFGSCNGSVFIVGRSRDRLFPTPDERLSNNNDSEG
ncbi:hypothetical protein LSH36_37g05027 [Paralvinella palmiformis]|uniref:Uncharacterized protein n=1 Tax=Paralvinella palmiformis TaxID=53620 RepID=A0AAD9K8D3_9ANNE|nr:hypothetical protein LSH36_37g05027 [Paralvinella palmiformis]